MLSRYIRLQPRFNIVHMPRTQLIDEFGRLLTLQGRPNVAETALDALDSAGYAVVKLPGPDNRGNRGPSWGIDDEGDVVSVRRKCRR